MIGTLINVAAILVGVALGLVLRRGMKPRVSQTVMQGVGLSVVLIGLSGALETENTLLVILSMVLGGVAGSLLDIQARMDRLGQWAQRRLSRGGEGADNTFAQGFVTASLVFCVGAMAVVGALDSGIRGDHSTLIAKSALDGVAAAVFASSMGVGVMLSAVPVLVYQGLIALLGTVVAPLLSDSVITEMSAVGGLLIAAIGLNMVLDKDIKVANLLPAILVPFLYFPIYRLIVG
ncbi:MAG TPA: DUF554 domain-containing protein [Candidatus Limiplasma stercoravium]|nr:DUF554 domain-containing protein [Candidatus Limiplasma stercoravium]